MVALWTILNGFQPLEETALNETVRRQVPRMHE